MITNDGIDILNTARRILERADADASRAAWSAEAETATPGPASLGRAAEAASAAADAIFNFLNVAHNYGGVDMTYEQLHLRPREEEVEA